MTDFNLFSTFRMIFSFSFLVALTGAVSPGPLLTYTIIKSVQTKKCGYLMGPRIAIGHALFKGYGAYCAGRINRNILFLEALS